MLLKCWEYFRLGLESSLYVAPQQFHWTPGHQILGVCDDPQMTIPSLGLSSESQTRICSLAHLGSLQSSSGKTGMGSLSLRLAATAMSSICLSWPTSSTHSSSCPRTLVPSHRLCALLLNWNVTVAVWWKCSFPNKWDFQVSCTLLSYILKSGGHIHHTDRRHAIPWILLMTSVAL